jgi:prepilin-type N-terminal cleavage/methylation domain-containing protein
MPEAEASPTPRTSRAADARRRAFSLLEVLAAVMILSIWYMIIANSAMVGLRSEGESLRRIEAGRIADRKLAEFEALALSGSAPLPEQQTEEVDGFELEWEVANLTFGVRARPPAEGEPPVTPTALRGFVNVHTPSAGTLIRSITVRVTWTEGVAPRSVVRSTFAFDREKAAEIYQKNQPEEDADEDADPDAGVTTGSREEEEE